MQLAFHLKNPSKEPKLSSKPPRIYFVYLCRFMDEEGNFNNLFHFICTLGYTYNVWCLSSAIYTKDVRHTVVSLCLKVYFIIEKWWSTISTDVRPSRAVWNVIWNVLFSWMRMIIEGYFTTKGDINLPSKNTSWTKTLRPAAPMLSHVRSN